MKIEEEEQEEQEENSSSNNSIGYIKIDTKANKNDIISSRNNSNNNDEWNGTELTQSFYNKNHSNNNKQQYGLAISSETSVLSRSTIYVLFIWCVILSPNTWTVSLQSVQWRSWIQLHLQCEYGE